MRTPGHCAIKGGDPFSPGHILDFFLWLNLIELHFASTVAFEGRESTPYHTAARKLRDMTSSTEEWGTSDASPDRASAELSGDGMTEATGLLNESAPEETWVGYQEFAGLPWWKRPSVC